MTKKHFIQIAGAFKKLTEQDSLNGYQDEILHLLAEDLCVIFEQANPLFDRARFMTACGF